LGTCIQSEEAVAFVAARVDAARAAAIEAHLAGCAPCRELVAIEGSTVPTGRDARPEESRTVMADHELSPSRRDAGPSQPGRPQATLARGTTVGRYTILELVGRGGMGEVFAAYDPELDRKIALKFLRGDSERSSASAEVRLLREAKAIAKVSHPHIVAVYDAGTFGARVFVAMEFVEGATLKHWLAERPRTRAEILAVFEKAARGLEAAHAVGLVHRDFKPQNVMVRADGGVRVMDFGLVRQLTGPDDAEREDDVRAASALSDEHDLLLTRTGDLIGTPAYMAPEQLKGERTDARCDQFSFCVALYGALYGARPFEGETLATLQANVLGGRVRPPPAQTDVPSWQRRVLLRGLAPDAGTRFPSMSALLDALLDDPGARRRRRLLIAAGAVAAVGLLVVANRVGSRPRSLCADGPGRLAGIWEAGGADSPRKQAIRDAFARSGKSFAAELKGTTALLDAYVGRWTAMYRDSCEATRVRGEQPEDVRALRESCLDDRLRDLRALTDVYAKADQSVVLNATSAADALPSLETCADVPALQAQSASVDPGARARIDGLRDRLARVEALSGAGQCDAAEAQGRPLLDDLRAARYRPLLAEALFAMGSFADTCGDSDAAIAWCKEAYTNAVAARQDRIAAQAAFLVAYESLNKYQDAKSAADWLDDGRAFAERVGIDDRMKALQLNVEARYQQQIGAMDEAVTTTRQAYELTRRVYGPDHRLSVNGLNDVGLVLADAGHLDEALAAYAEARVVTERVLGRDHPEVGVVASNTCEVLNRLGRHAEAETACARALEIWASTGAAEQFVSFGRTQLGVALLGLGRSREAIAPLELAVRDEGAAHDAPLRRAESGFALARALWSRAGAQERAVAVAKQARANAASDPALAARIGAWLSRSE
jgi:tRNA A-37 threonylcarbamoyl transferase component Bud32/tetratricopeptide (TPR) repeat protein